MADTAPAAGDSPASAMTSRSSPTPTLSQAISSVNIKAFIPYTLSMESNNYRKWRNLMLVVLGRFHLRSHVEDMEPNHDDPDWATENLQVLMWIYATIDASLTDMVMEDNTTAFGVWQTLRSVFCSNKPSRAVHLESELLNLVQGDLSVAAYCHKLKTIADALADCDQPVRERALVHHLIRGLNPKFHVLKTIMPMLPTFPTFMQARDYLLVEEQSKEAEKPTSSKTALVVGGPGSGPDAPSQHSDAQDSVSPNTYHNNSGGRSRGFRGRGRGRGGRNGGGRGRHQQQPLPPWMVSYPPWNSSQGQWRAPWTGATGPGVLGARPPSHQGHAFPVMQPTTSSAPLQASSWDVNGLLHALHVMSQQQQQQTGNNEWYMDTGASSHMTGDAGSSQQDSTNEVQ